MTIGVPIDAWILDAVDDVIAGGGMGTATIIERV